MNIVEMQDIINIAMAVNGFSQRQAPPDLPTVFVKMSGHIALIMIRVYEHGWRKGTDEDRYFEFFTNAPLDENDMSEYRTYMASITPNLGEEAIQRV